MVSSSLALQQPAPSPAPQSGAAGAADCCGAAGCLAGASSRASDRSVRAAPVRSACDRPDSGACRRRQQVAEPRRPLQPRIVAVVDVPGGGHPGQSGDDRPCLCLAGDLDDLLCQDGRSLSRALRRLRGRCSRSDRRCPNADGGAVRARRKRQRVVGLAGRGDAAKCGSRATAPSDERHQGAGRLALCRDRARRSAPDAARHGILATIGATSPFVGLFGTVWGIMNSFIGISKSQTTNLAVVAPGIAEALLATAIGLVAAIPAVIIYNHFSRATKGYLELVGRAIRRGRPPAVARSRPRAQSPGVRIRARRSKRWADRRSATSMTTTTISRKRTISMSRLSSTSCSSC